MPALQRAIYARPDIADIEENIADTASDRLRRDKGIRLRDRFENGFVDSIVELKNRSIRAFPRVGRDGSVDGLSRTATQDGEQSNQQ